MRRASIWIGAAVSVLAAPSSSNTIGPTVRLDNTVFQGSVNASNPGSVGVQQFLGIPFANAPRFALPRPAFPYTKSGIANATNVGLSCLQQAVLSKPLSPPFFTNATVALLSSDSKFLHPTNPLSEDCLNINVLAPPNATKGANLPVVVFIFGGGFEIGGSQPYPGQYLVARSVALQQPAIYVGFNYRLSAWGFLASKEVLAAGAANAGLHDQRMALQWVQRYISEFGGSPDKVTIWGHSAGAFSVGYHMIIDHFTNERLFRGAWMQSGSPYPVSSVLNGQPYYDMLVANTGCNATNITDTLACLRAVDATVLQTAINMSPGFVEDIEELNIIWQPRVDGVLLKDDPQKLVQRGQFVNVPYVTGDTDDEGTQFGLAPSVLNITTNDDFQAYIHSNYFPGSSVADVEPLMTLYPQDPAAGSPFDTGSASAATPQYKRIAAFAGDYGFQAPRRFFLKSALRGQNKWAYLTKRFKSTPFIGAIHISDMHQFYAPDGSELQDYLIHFVNGLDPNFKSQLINWPQWTNISRAMVATLDGLTPIEIIQDNYREAALQKVSDLQLKYPL